MAGVSRQTVYAHFASRDALVGAVIDRAGAEFATEIDGAHLDTRTPPDALVGFLEIGWEYLRRYLPLLLNSTVSHPPRLDGDDPPHPVTKRLEQIIRRGRRTGDFDRALPATWLTDAILRLGHTAAEHVASGHLSAPKAAAMLRESALRLCGASVNRAVRRAMCAMPISRPIHGPGPSPWRMARMATVVRRHHRSYTRAVDERPPVVRLQIVVGIAQWHELVDAGVAGHAVLEPIDMVVLEPRPPSASLTGAHRLFPQQRDLLRGVRPSSEVGHVADVDAVGDHQLQHGLTQHLPSSRHGDGAEPGNLAGLALLNIAADQRRQIDPQHRRAH